MENKPPIFQNPDAEGGTFFWPAEKNKAVAILLFHGFTATTVEVRTLAAFFKEQGFSVMGPLLPGHGVSPDELNQTKWQDWVEAAENAYQQLAGKYERVFVMGESMGGLCTLWLAAHHPEIAGIAMFAPALRIPKLWQSRIACAFIPFMYKKNIDLTSSWQGFNVVPMCAAAQLYQFQQKIKRLLAKIEQPAIIFQGKLDTTIDPISSVRVLEGIKSPDKEMVWLEESPHCILLDKQMPVVEQLCLDFINGIAA